MLHPYAQLGLCVGGIYASFIVWALCQERLSTTPYESIAFPTTDKFRSVLFLNTIQSSFCAVSALAFLLTTKSRPGMTWSALLGVPKSTGRQPPVLGVEDLKRYDRPLVTPTRTSPGHLLRSYAFISLMASLAAPFGFLSLSYISFPTLLLGKSCKLVPVMVMNIVLYRRKYPMHKYVLVGMVTTGIWAFMAFKEGKKKGGPETSSLLGLLLLGINLILDGVVNSTQDEVFSKYIIDGPQMMFFMNVFSTLITTAALLFPTALTPSFLAEAPSTTGETYFNALSSALSFISTHPSVTFDIITFSLCGAVGQLFIFVTLSLYGSLTLVTITVTRKMMTMLLSVFLFDHRLTFGQWSGVGLVFAAIGMEAYESYKSKKKKKSKV
ncbi:UDP-Glc/Gal endoplasmic reticulum nucleotide sugar transporter [Pseudohyphozyma bogoriensis]|nr:UDP-Glc/Gal endoplasmic reticulum nucleotide sugar transporter [Pseudohyphozyma bogoriensis]